MAIVAECKSSRKWMEKDGGWLCIFFNIFLLFTQLITFYQISTVNLIATIPNKFHNQAKPKPVSLRVSLPYLSVYAFLFCIFRQSLGFLVEDCNYYLGRGLGRVDGPMAGLLAMHVSCYKGVINYADFFYKLLIFIDMCKHLLAFLTIIALTIANCPANYNIDGLVADSVAFLVPTNSSSSSLSYSYNYPQAFINAPVVALALQDFSVNYLAANSFAVYPSAASNGQITFQFDFSATVWTRVKVNFWASANSQIQLGYFKVDNIQTLGTCNCALAYTNINAPFAQSANPVIRVFINGFDVSSNSVQLSVSATNLQGTKLSIKITVGAATAIRRIWLSWLAFSPSTASFGSYGGQVSQSKYSGSVSSDVSNSLYQNTYSLYGLNLISLTNTQPLAFSSSIDANYVLTIASSALVDDFSLVYVTVGVLPSKVCSACGNGFVANGGDCVSACPSGTFSSVYKDGGVACRTCSSKLGFILSGGKCVVGTTTTTTVTTSTTVSAHIPVATVVSATAASGVQSGSIQSGSASQSTASNSVPAPSVTPVVNVPPASVPANTSATTFAATTASSASSTSSASTTFKPTCPENAFFIGNECTCEVGYVYQNGKCQLPLIPTTPIVVPKPVQTTNTTNNSNSKPTPTPSPTNPNKTATSLNCGANSYDNGLGICVCSTGFYFSNGVCTAGVACGSNSRRNADGSCSCETGFTNYSGVCSRCPQGALWSSSSNQCIFVCGQNAAYSASASQCVCNPGFGLLSGSCQACPNNYFISNGYCVTCPVNSNYNSVTKNCDCLSGFFTNQWGICARKCGTNEVYNSTTQACSCIAGLGRVNGACQICPTGSTPTNDGGSSCSTCGVNQVLIAGKCACQQGFAFNSANVCTACASLSNGFLVNGICAVCPGSLVYNGETCACPAGKTIQGSSCVSQCQNDELLDSNGNCYTCGLNQVVSNGQCICRTGYTLSSCGNCVLSCGSDQFSFQGSCATCPLNTVFNSAINGCSCPSGFYMNTYGICDKLTLQPINCSSGQYFDQNNGCLACSSSCATCKSANVCLTCTNAGFSPNSQGACAPKCGDGLIVGSETCDTGSGSSAGCSNCQVQSGFVCSGQPSVCRSTATPVTPTTNTTTNTNTPVVTPAAAALSQVGTANINSNNVFITLKTSTTFTFANPTEMQSFLQATFPSGSKPTVYCAQRASPNLNLFDCLLIYPSGVPNAKFQVNFAFNYQGKSGAVTVSVDPLAINAAKNSGAIRA